MDRFVCADVGQTFPLTMLVYAGSEVFGTLEWSDASDARCVLSNGHQWTFRRNLADGAIYAQRHGKTPSLFGGGGWANTGLQLADGSMLHWHCARKRNALCRDDGAEVVSVEMRADGWDVVARNELLVQSYRQGAMDARPLAMFCLYLTALQTFDWRQRQADIASARQAGAFSAIAGLS